MTARNDRQPGDKLLPKITQAVIQSVIATKLGLTGHEHNLRVNAGQELIDRLGHEIADLYEPFMRTAITDERLSPMARDFIQKVASGDNQWQAVAGFAVSASGATNVLGQVIGNELAPVGYDLIQTNPHLIPDTSSILQLFAKRIIPESTATDSVNKLGYDTGWFDALAESQWNWPDVATAYSMYHRQLIDSSDLTRILEYNGVPPDLIQQFFDMEQSILTAADAALAVLRTDLTLDQGRAIAEANGYTDDDFNTMLLNTGEPPGAEELMEAYRRGFITEDQFKLGIAQSRVRDQWTDTLLKLRYSPISTADAVNAYVEGYITESDVQSYADQNGLEPDQYKILVEAAGDPLSYTDMMRLWRYGYVDQTDVQNALKQGRLKDSYIPWALLLKDAPMSVPDAIEAYVQGYLTEDQAKTIAELNGLRAEDFDPLRLAAGDPLSKTEMITLWRRGLVSEDQVKAALQQSRLKDSYIDLALNLKVQLPALYETRALLADGGLTAEQGTQILLAQGYESDIVKSIVSNAIGATTASTKALTEAMYADLYKEQSITASEFIEELEVLGYTQAQGELIQSIYDNQLAISSRNQVITKIKAGYVGHKITEQDAQNELNQLGVAADMVDRLIDDWNLIIASTIKQLTAAEVTDAWFMNLFSPNDSADNTSIALNYLANLGYSAADAITILEIKNKGPLDNGTKAKPIPASGTTGSTATGGQ